MQVLAGKFGWGSPQSGEPLFYPSSLILAKRAKFDRIFLMNRRIKKFLIIILIAIFAFYFILVSIGFYLAPQDNLQKSDTIIVLSGGETKNRTLEGVKLYKENWAPKIIFSGAAKEGDVSNALAMEKIALEEGVNKSDLILEEQSKTTSENASFCSKIIKNHSFKKIILVTSPYHQRRAYNSFKKYLPDVDIINHPAFDSSWRKKNWWEQGKGRLLTLNEIFKIAFLSFQKD